MAAYLVGLLLLREHVWARYGLILIGCWYGRHHDHFITMVNIVMEMVLVLKILMIFTIMIITMDGIMIIQIIIHIFSPGGTGSNFWTALFGGDINLSITMTFCRSSSIITITITINFPLQHTGQLWYDHLLALVLCQVRPSSGCPRQAALSSSE